MSTSMLAAPTTFDKIVQHYRDESVVLSDKEKEVLSRWETAFTFMRKHRTVSQTVDLLMRFFPDISKVTAYRDVVNAQRLFGSVMESNKEGLRHLLTEFCMDLIARAKKNGDMKAENAAIANMIKINGLDREDPDLPDFSKLQPHQYNIQLPPEVLELLLNIVKSGKINISDIMNKMAVDVRLQE